MKKLLHIALLSALAFSFTPMKAAVTDVKELYGTWTFYGTPSVSTYPSTCKVTIGQVDGRTVITNFAGNDKALTAGLDNGKLNVNGVNIDDNLKGDWTAPDGSDLFYSNAEGINPFATGVSLEFTILEDGKKLTTPDFTLVSLNRNGGDTPDKWTPTIIVTYTNCNMIWEKGESVEEKPATDMSGNWHFEVDPAKEGDPWGNSMPSSDFPTTFDMTLTATNDMFTAYSAAIKFPDYEPVTIENVTFNDEKMTFQLDSDYIDADEKIAFGEAILLENGGVDYYNLNGTFVFKKKDNTLTMDFPYIIIVKEQEGKQELHQYYMNGTATKEVEGIDFAGTYTVTTPQDAIEYADPLPTDYTIPETWQLKIEKAESGNGYVITTFLNTDLQTLGMTISANVSAENPNVLEIPTVSAPSEDGNRSPSVVVDRGEGHFLAIAENPEVPQTPDNKITFTYDEEAETYTLSDFILMYVTDRTDLNSTEYTLNVGRPSSAVKSSSGVKEAEADAAPAQSCVYTVNGSIVIAGEPTRVEVYSLTGACLYDGITNEIGGLKRGYYLVRTGKNVNKVILK